jgi:hypothetical protein
MKQLPDIYPKEWANVLNIDTLDLLEFRNLTHFKTHLSKLTQKHDMACDISYKDALAELVSGSSNFDSKEYATIRNLVRSNLLKKGLLTQEVYENYKYGVDGTAVDYDMGKYAAGEPDCVINPGVEYIDHFYELYINCSYNYTIKNEAIAEKINKMLATVEELQRQHINIKITLVKPTGKINTKNDFLSTVPLFSHRDFKDAATMSSIINNRILRKFYFAIYEDRFGEDLAEGYGKVISLPKCMNLDNKFNEVSFFTEIQAAVGVVNQ